MTATSPLPPTLEQVPDSLRSERCVLASDLHLDGTARRETGLRRLLAASQARGADLLLLGDVFHYWFGRRHLGTGMYRRELALLRAATRSGQRVVLVPGNRDFLLDDSFAAATGVVVTGDALVVEMAGERVLCSHGDLLSTRDVRYQRMRRLLRLRMVTFLAHRLPARVVSWLAGRLRRYSECTVREKPAAVLEPDEGLVRQLLGRGFDAVICGHFHQCREQHYPADEGGGRFMVLEPFEEHGYYLARDVDGWVSDRLESKES